MSTDLRNIAFVGHPSSGKTTLVDALAYALGASDRKGSVADKTSICDTEPEEQERQHTLLLATVHAEKSGLAWNLIDTPGYPEFIGDAISAIYATELCVGVVSCSSGVTFNLIQKMRTAAEIGRGRAIVVTHIDADNADFDALVEELRTRVGEICVPLLTPDQSLSRPVQRTPLNQYHSFAKRQEFIHRRLQHAHARGQCRFSTLHVPSVKV